MRTDTVHVEMNLINCEWPWEVEDVGTKAEDSRAQAYQKLELAQEDWGQGSTDPEAGAGMGVGGGYAHQWGPRRLFSNLPVSTFQI